MKLIAIGFLALPLVTACSKPSSPEPRAAASVVAPHPIVAHPESVPAPAAATGATNSAADVLAESRGDWKSPLDTYRVHN